MPKNISPENGPKQQSNFTVLLRSLRVVDRLLRPDIVNFHLACLGTETFLRELKRQFKSK
jgi:hypothetical protein